MESSLDLKKMTRESSWHSSCLNAESEFNSLRHRMPPEVQRLMAAKVGAFISQPKPRDDDELERRRRQKDGLGSLWTKFIGLASSWQLGRLSTQSFEQKATRACALELPTTMHVLMNEYPGQLDSALQSC